MRDCCKAGDVHGITDIVDRVLYGCNGRRERCFRSDIRDKRCRLGCDTNNGQLVLFVNVERSDGTIKNWIC